MPFALLRHILPCLVVTAALATPTAGFSRGDPATLCRDAAAQASEATGVPFEVLMAVATVETGRNDKPWPWTVNFGGDGHWFDNAAEAEASVDRALSDGATNIDLGCFQLNYRWHSDAFASIEDMLDPARNASYAAGYLARQYARTGDWALAAAAYHSASPDHARVYQSKFEATYARLATGEAPDLRKLVPSPHPEPTAFRCSLPEAAG